VDTTEHVLPDEGDGLQSPKRRVLSKLGQWVMSSKFVILIALQSNFLRVFCCLEKIVEHTSPCEAYSRSPSKVLNILYTKSYYPDVGLHGVEDVDCDLPVCDAV
jgi:hypothetical protein